MRFQTTAAFAMAMTMATLATAQLPADVPSEACITCISSSMMAVPACAALGNIDPNSPLRPKDGATFSAEERACACSLATNLSWFKSCSSCPDSFLRTMNDAYAASKPLFCDGAGLGSGSGSGSGVKDSLAVSTNQVRKTGGIVVAALVMTAHALL
ncbi:hypothetical protein BGZ94_005238 [Podila epigama]|nr:hypothetical protein BGZ94_005238 [Podila epigama]